LLLALRPASLDRIAIASVFSPHVLLFTAGTAVLWGVLFSLAPLREAIRRDLLSVLQQDTRITSGRQRLRSSLVVAQIALSVVLAVSAGLMLRTFSRLLQVDPGFDASSAISFRLALPGNRYPTPEAFNNFSRQLEARLRALPDVSAAGAVSHLPYDGVPNWGGPYAGELKADDSDASNADYRAISPGFFEAAKIKLIEGRNFTEADDTKGPLVVIVDELLARKMWPGRSAVGQKLLVDPFSTGHAKEQAMVIGVVHHLRLRSLTEELTEQAFFSQRQIRRNPAAYIVKTQRDPAELASSIRKAVSGLDAALPIYDVRPLSDYLTSARSGRQFTMLLAIVFAAIALALAAVGVYGVMAYSVGRRRYEFGIRMALGANPAQVVRLVLREGALLAMAGAVLGLLGALFAANFLRALLFGVSSHDSLSYFAPIVVLIALALLACWIPARRASAKAIALGVLRCE
jgi:putative ABC transport system permease protein